MNVGLIAHDSKKKLMQNFCIAYRGILSKNSLYATGTTGRLIEEVTNLNVHKYLSGHLGGDQQRIADRVSIKAALHIQIGAENFAIRGHCLGGFINQRIRLFALLLLGCCPFILIEG